MPEDEEDMRYNNHMDSDEDGIPLASIEYSFRKLDPNTGDTDQIDILVDLTENDDIQRILAKFVLFLQRLGIPMTILTEYFKFYDLESGRPLNFEGSEKPAKQEGIDWNKVLADKLNPVATLEDFKGRLLSDQEFLNRVYNIFMDSIVRND